MKIFKMLSEKFNNKNKKIISGGMTTPVELNFDAEKNEFLDNLSRKEKKFCPLFADGKKCHILSGDRLNCLGCYCPYFSAEVNEKDGFIECGLCTVSSPAARRAVSAKNPKLTVLDCSMCVIPHQHSRVWEILNRDFPRANG